MAQLVLGVAGAVVGGLIGGPVGASIGWSVGAAVGGLLDPPKSEGPRLDDLKLQVSQYGRIIPRIYGTVRIAGNVIWQTDLEEHKEKSGGKGGPEVTSYTYSASFAVMLCESDDGTDHKVQRLLKIWADGRVVWPVAGDASAVPFVVYYGDATQQPDPTIEAVEGVGEVPAHRGYCYVVFTDWFLTEFGNRIPSLEFELSTVDRPSGPITMLDMNEDTTWANGTAITEWNTAWDSNPVLENPSSTFQAQYSYFEWNIGPGPIIAAIRAEPIGTYVYADGSTTTLYFNYGPHNAIGGTLPVGIQTDVYPAGNDFCDDAGIPAGRYAAGCILSRDGTIALVFTNPAFDLGGTTIDRWHKVVDGVMVDEGDVDPPMGFPEIGHGNRTTYSNSYNASMMEDNGEWIWQVEGNGFYGTRPTSSPPASSGHVRLLHIDPATNILSVDTGAGYGYDFTALTGFTRPSGFVTEEGYFGIVMDTYTAIFTRLGPQGTVLLSDIVSDLSLSAGLASNEYDASALTDEVSGFVLASQMEVRNAVDVLRQGFFFDAAEVDDEVVFVRRDGVSVATISDDDLAARDYGTDAPPLLELVRTQELELPRIVNVDHIDADTDYQTGTQSAERQVTEALSETTITLPIVFTPSEARAKAQSHIFGAHLERDRGAFFVSRKWARLVPTDIVTIQGRDYRLTKKSETPRGVIKFDCVPYLAAVYEQPVEGVTGEGFSPVLPTAKPDTLMVLLPVPMITDTDSETGFKVALGPESTGPWTGASAYKSSDGTNYTAIVSTPVEDTIGEATTALGDFYGGNVFDHLNTVTVLLSSGTLSSVDADAVLNGANMAVLGLEVFQFQTATLVGTNTYTLSGLLRGRRGTEAATAAHSEGERFVLLNVADYAAPVGELFQSLQYKGVTFGKTLASVTPQTFANMGVAARPYSPVHAFGGSDASGNLTINWVRRTRIGGTWKDFADVPLSEPTEAYVVQIWDSAYTLCARIIEVTSPTASYTAAQQVTDFGAVQATVYATVGQIGAYALGQQTRVVIDGTGSTVDTPLAPVTPYNASPTPPPGGSGGSVNQAITTYPSGQIVTNGVVVGDTYVVSFASNGSPVNTRISIAEYGDPPTFRKVVLANDVNGNSIIQTFWGIGATAYFTPAISTTYYLIITVEVPGGGTGRPLGEGADLVCSIQPSGA